MTSTMREAGLIERKSPAEAVAAMQSGYRIHRLRWLDPRLERERSRDGSCTNLSAAERNRKKLDAANMVSIDHVNRAIHCPTHVYRALMAALDKEGLR